MDWGHDFAGVAFHACRGRGVIHLYKWSLQDGELGPRAEIDAHKVHSAAVEPLVLCMTAQ